MAPPTHTNEPLDPTPTMFGISRIASELNDGGATEYNSAVEWINERAQRFAFRAYLVANLIGDAIALQNLRASLQPLRDFQDDLQAGYGAMPDDADDDYIGNQGLNP